MTAIIYGKIIDAWRLNPNEWLFKLKQYFGIFGESPLQWEVFGGNAFLLKINDAEEALWTAICIKAIFKQIPPLDVHISIGLGDETHIAQKIRNNKGTAYELSCWEDEDQIGEQKIAVHTANSAFDNNINLLLAFALLTMDNWSVVAAEIVELCIVFPEKNQQEIADWLKIKQSAVSQRRKRAQYDLIFKLNEYFKTQLKNVF